MLISVASAPAAAVESVIFEFVPATNLAMTLCGQVLLSCAFHTSLATVQCLLICNQGPFCLYSNIAVVAERVLLQGLGNYWISQDALGQ